MTSRILCTCAPCRVYLHHYLCVVHHYHYHYHYTQTFLLLSSYRYCTTTCSDGLPGCFKLQNSRFLAPTQHQYGYLKNEAMYRTTLCGRRLKRVCGCVLLCSSTPCSCGWGTMNKSRTVSQRTLLVTFCSSR